MSKKDAIRQAFREVAAGRRSLFDVLCELEQSGQARRLSPTAIEKYVAAAMLDEQ